MTKSLSRNFSVYMLKSLVSIFVPLITIPYVSRILGPSGIGDVQYVQSWVSYFTLIAGLGISSYAVREGAKLRDNLKELRAFSSEIIVISLLSTIAAYLAFSIFLYFFKSLHSHIILFIVCSALIAATGLNTEWACTIFEDYDYIAKRSVAFQIISVVLMFVFVKQQSDAVWYAITLVTPTVCASLLNWVYGMRKIHWRYSFKKIPAAINKHIKPIFFIFGIGVASTIYTSLDSTMIGYLIGTEAVGIYTVASRLSKSVLSLINASCVVFLPRLSYYAGTNKREFHKLSSQVINALLLLAIPCATGLFVLSKEMISLFSGSGFEAAVVPMKILSIDLFFSALDGFLAWQILIPMNRERNLLVATITGMSVDCILNAIFIRHSGVVGAAIATLIAEICVCVVSIISCYDLLQFKPMIKNIFQCIIATIPFFVIYRISTGMNILEIGRVAVVMVCCLIVYIIGLILIHNEIGNQLLQRIKMFVTRYR